MDSRYTTLIAYLYYVRVKGALLHRATEIIQFFSGLVGSGLLLGSGLLFFNARKGGLLLEMGLH